MRVSAAGNMPLQGLVKPPAKPVVMITIIHFFAFNLFGNRRDSPERSPRGVQFALGFFAELFFGDETGGHAITTFQNRPKQKNTVMLRSSSCRCREANSYKSFRRVFIVA